MQELQQDISIKGNVIQYQNIISTEVVSRLVGCPARGVVSPITTSVSVLTP